MINYDNHKELILSLDSRGLSSSEIAEVLGMKTPDKNFLPRSIRQALQRWGRGKGRTEPAKILVFDIESSPMVTYSWQAKTRYITPDKVISDWFVICWSAKWLFDDEIINCSVTEEEALEKDDKRVVGELWKLLNEADIVIAHNGDNFDIRKMNARFAKHKMNLPSPYSSIDTYKSARKRLNLSYYRLSYIAEYFGLTQKKQDTNFKMWVDCLNGDKSALDKMQGYCDQDIRVLEDVYLYLRPYIQPHPNLGLYIEEESNMCPSCASTDLDKCGTYATTVNLYEAYRCKNCGSLTRARKHCLTKEDKETITSSIPK
jgi:RNA polymerase subunit RPABC4/transcription elongation factor Spt4